MFANAAALLRGHRPDTAVDGQARGLLETLGYALGRGTCVEATGTEAETLDRARLLQAAAQFKRIFELDAPEAPGLVCFGAEVDPATVDPMHRGSPLLGVSGVGLTLAEAFQRCAGEGIEYMSQLQGGDDVLVRASLVDRAAALDSSLRDYVATLASSADAELSWYRARRLADQSEVLLPADLCLRRPEAQRDFVPPFPLSIGSAAGTSFEGAALHGLLELIERDAASLWWRGGSRGRAIPADEIGADALLSKLRVAGSAWRRTWLLDITTDVGVPSVVAISCRPDGFGFAFGLATRPTLASAVRSAILEMCQLELAYAVIEAKREERGEAWLNAKDRVHIQRATAVDADRCMLLQPVDERVEYMDIDATDPRETLERIALRLDALEIEAFFLDLTRPRYAIPVVRIIAPSLQLEPSEIVTPRLAKMMAQTGGGAAYTGGIPLL
jgi:ribosomal protein S12 methylthiotransferase accessory factor